MTNQSLAANLFNTFQQQLIQEVIQIDEGSPLMIANFTREAADLTTF